MTSLFDSVLADSPLLSPSEIGWATVAFNIFLYKSQQNAIKINEVGYMKQNVKVIFL